MRILLADDDAVYLHLVTTRLRAQGHEVAVARDAMQVLMTAMRYRPEAILIDINMPGGTGLQALKQLKANANTKSIPVIVISGVEDVKMPSVVKQLGAVEFLSKPFCLEDTLRALQRVVNKHPQSVASAEKALP